MRLRLPGAGILLGGLLAAGAAPAQQVDLSALDRNMPGTPTRVLVLGTVHLGQEGGKDIGAAALKPLLDRLRAYAPDIVTIEALPGETCELMARYPAAYAPEVTGTYCPDTAAAKAATGLDVPAAVAEADRLLAAWPPAPSPAQRRRLAAIFLAAGDPTSALVQWLQLPEAERRAGDGLDEALAASLREREGADNENYRIAAPLAAALGLQRVHPVDDHTGDNLRIADEQGFEQAIRRAWDGARPRCAAERARADALARRGDALDLYRRLNGAEYLRAAVACDFGAALAEPSPQRFGRQYVAGWDARNLRMVANILVTFRERPGARVLSLVGASHKPWFDSLLGQVQGVEVVDAAQALE
jgi:hypothetical protein